MKDIIYFPDTQGESQEAVRKQNMINNYKNQELPEEERKRRIDLIRKGFGL